MNEIRKILIFYIVFFTSFCLALIPVNAVFVFALMICVCMLAALYMERTKTREGTFFYIHITFIIQSFWRGILLLLATILVGGLYLALIADYEPLAACFNALDKAISQGHITRLGSIVKACEELFLEENANHLTFSAVLTFAPVIFYLIYRCATGIICARDGRLIPVKIMDPDAKMFHWI